MASISGIWYNQLGSSMEISVDGKGLISGTYTTHVGNPPRKKFPLSGYMDMTGNEGSKAVGFTVAWQGYNSVTAWSGQFQIIIGGRVEEIVTTWLLTEETAYKNDWSSTNVGQDVFRRILWDEKEGGVIARKSSSPIKE